MPTPRNNDWRDHLTEARVEAIKKRTWLASDGSGHRFTDYALRNKPTDPSRLAKKGGSNGYPAVKICGGGREWVVPVMAVLHYAETGQTPTDTEVYQHKCLEPRCVEPHPDHVVLGANIDNRREVDVRKLEHGLEDARDIRRAVAMGVPQATLAREYGVSDTTISEIVKEQAWREEAE